MPPVKEPSCARVTAPVMGWSGPSWRRSVARDWFSRQRPSRTAWPSRLVVNTLVTEPIWNSVSGEKGRLPVSVIAAAP